MKLNLIYGVLRSLAALCLLKTVTFALATGDGSFPFSTVVDILSQNPEFSTFLRLIQREGFVPLLNSMDNYTLFAPVNSAFIDGDESGVSEEFVLEHYILLNNVLDVKSMAPGTYILESQSYPLSMHKGNDGRSALNGKVHVVDPNLAPNFQNATVHGIDSFIVKPPTLYELVSSHPGLKMESVSLMEHLVKTSMPDSNALKNGKFRLQPFVNGSTIFLPTDAALSKFFNDIELNYLFDLSNSDFTIPERREDLEILTKMIIVDKLIGGAISENYDILYTKSGEPLAVHSKNKGHDLVINGSTAVVSNLIFDQGIVHIVSDLPIVETDITFNVEKYLLGLNASSFVEELHIRKFKKLVNDPKIEQTIFVTKDAMSENSEDGGLSKSQLLYHFIEHKVNLAADFETHYFPIRLYESMFCSSNKRLGGKCQRMKVSKYGDHLYLNEKYHVLNLDPISIDNTMLYIVDDNLMLPGDLVSSINPFFHCAKSLKFLQQLNLLDLKPNDEGYTLFLPCFNAWDDMQLVTDYIERNISAMNILMKNYVLNGLFYSDSDNFTSDTTDLFGENVTVKTGVTNETADHLSLSLSTVDHEIQLKKSFDMIFSQGVVHPINEVYFPNILDIGLRQLIETIGTYDFLVFLEKFPEFNDILTGSAPYSLLIPTQRSLLMEGIDLNYTKLEKFLKLHILPLNQTHSLMECADKIDTVAGESLKCREASDNILLLSVMDGVDKEVRILKKGCTTGNSGSCVFLIDRPISVQWLNKERYSITLPALSFALGTVLGTMFLFSLLLCVIVTCAPKKSSKDKDSRRNSDVENNEQEPLIQADVPSNRSQNSSYRATVNAARNHSQVSPTFESSYSANAKTAPMKMRQNSSEFNT
ncbi:unnamed protein product [Kluyveromyces dobzhanskii CBS 2104]|uniref:WGS project CCBQ000000000 data, contig 00102 n=1 Tax=Kluyveromyces dobzhanskii CBS 2104 TaxID=1427455 RepID=A0A0A8L3U1_9SACH|nr:unnamed protein product [Kluyveromyces dobzhanskii CBS 2104]